MSDQPLSARPRIAGVTVPLFSIRTERSWGIGEIGDLPDFAAWVAEAGLKLVQILPLGEISANETSPYSALSAFGIDPMYISLAQVADLPESELHAALGDEGTATLARIRGVDRVDYGGVRDVKNRALRFAFERFQRLERTSGSTRAHDFEAFVDHQRHWLEDYALFRALKNTHGGKAWWEWPDGVRAHQGEALGAARASIGTEVLYYQYLQWLAHSQWLETRAKLHAAGIEIMGDLPFMVGRDSADVWSNQREFRHDLNVGAPPDQFDQDGQDWGLPPYNWPVMRANDFAWLRRRARYAGSLYDRFRIDHLVGFFRTYVRPLQVRNAQGKLVKGTFDPADERTQLPHGERVVGAMVDAGHEHGAELVAEDLGVVPDFVRQAIAHLGVLGYKVLIWEKDGDVFRDPAKYPELSLACFGTHDTDPVTLWWESRSEAEREAVKRIPSWREEARALGPRFTPETHRALLKLILSAPSRLVLLLMQDVLATRERVNTPSTIGPQNWTYRLPGTVNQLRESFAAKAALDAVRTCITAAGR